MLKVEHLWVSQSFVASFQHLIAHFAPLLGDVVFAQILPVGTELYHLHQTGFFCGTIFNAGAAYVPAALAPNISVNAPVPSASTILTPVECNLSISLAASTDAVTPRILKPLITAANAVADVAFAVTVVPLIVKFKPEVVVAPAVPDTVDQLAFHAPVPTSTHVPLSFL